MIVEHCSSCLRSETAPTAQEPKARVGDTGDNDRTRVGDTGNIGDPPNAECQLPNDPQSPLPAMPPAASCDSLKTEHCQVKTIAEGDLPDMIPVRMLNEFTYCPRLGYLEWVEGEWAGNLETMEGTFGHRRVDQEPKRAKRKAESGDTMLPVSPTRDTRPTNDQPLDNVTSPPVSENRKLKTENQSIHARSLMLSSPMEGLLAKLDLLELEGMEATPVDYKRGKAPDIPEGAYEPERVQLCAQGLILRANGFQCDRGVLYFIASKKRVTIEFTAELIQRTRQLRDEFRLTAAAGILPPPLVDSPKCPRCSLVGICLPDKTNLLQCGSTLRSEISAEITDCCFSSSRQLLRAVELCQSVCSDSRCSRLPDICSCRSALRRRLTPRSDPCNQVIGVCGPWRSRLGSAFAYPIESDRDRFLRLNMPKRVRRRSGHLRIL